MSQQKKDKGKNFTAKNAKKNLKTYLQSDLTAGQL